MKRFFDSSILVPVFYADHPQHASSTKVFLEAGKDDFCALRTLGEVYATLTGLPLRPRVTGPEGISIVKPSYHRPYAPCVAKWLNQPGVKTTFVKLEDMGITGNGDQFMSEKK